MPTLFERIAARVAYWHASGVYRRFLRTLRDPDRVQQRVLRDVLSRMAGSDYARDHDLASVRSAEDLKCAAPLVNYENIRSYVDRLGDGELAALFAPDVRLHMFATSSGTTSRQKLIPVTSEFVRQYRRGWNTFGLKMLGDHPRAILRAILQVTGRHDERLTSAGVPCGAITGLLARSQKGIVRRYYVGVPDIALVSEPRSKYYTLMRFAVLRDVAFAITANPATLIRMAQTASEESERLIRDVRDGTLCDKLVPDAAVRRRLEAHLSPNAERARELELVRRRHDCLRPRDYWHAEFLACWTGGSMGHYLERLAEWWGPLPVRDIGLLASEGRVSMPLEDGTPAGVLDTQGAFFEFIPSEQWDRAEADTLTAREVEVGRDYTVVMTNHAGLVRYRLDDVVRVRGWLEQTPVLEFLHRAGRVASVAGEKLTENQVVEAVRVAASRLGIPVFDFVMAPHWGDPPFYQLNCVHLPVPGLAKAVDQALGEQNDEYLSRRKSVRLSGLRVRELDRGAIMRLDRRLMQSSGATPEQYKRPCLLMEPGADDKTFDTGK